MNNLMPFKHCPDCAGTNVVFEENKLIRCPDCGFVYYHNVAAATGLMIISDGSMALLERAKDPAKGMLDLPGGFVDPGEGAIAGLLRECREELGWTPDEKSIKLECSFANVYPYKNIMYNTCDMFFSIEQNGLCEKDFSLQISEVSAVRFIKLDKINFDDIAFVSAKRAIQTYRGRL
jgi:ADP-ribose pyrophosphatase YjhB (NUDIX family)